MLQAALIDVDGTLFDTERLFLQAWLHAGSAKGYPITEAHLLQFHGRGHTENCRSFQEWFGDDADYWGSRKIFEEYVERTIAEAGVPLKPGLHEFLDFLQKNGITIILATGTERSEAEPRWKAAEIDRYIQGSICGDEIENSKPNPEIFLRAAALAGAAPSECIVFEDSVNGLRAARSAGCYTVMVPDLDPVTDELRQTIADEVCHSLFDGIEMLRLRFGMQ
ncbi:MAG: HAD family phosphatase [Lachnospiraceae bacterium]|nr:HAD family phosphatase [Lachnospiraceae bacterium]